MFGLKNKFHLMGLFGLIIAYETKMMGKRMRGNKNKNACNFPHFESFFLQPHRFVGPSPPIIYEAQKLRPLFEIIPNKQSNQTIQNMFFFFTLDYNSRNFLPDLYTSI